MTQEDKELLLKDLCARLTYGVKAQVLGWDEEKGEVEVPLRIYSINTDGYVYFETNDYDVNYLMVDNCLLYLRPMSSMTAEEREEFESLGWRVDELDGNVPWNHNSYNVFNGVDWLNSHHFDYRGLIEKGLAIEAPEDMYKI